MINLYIVQECVYITDIQINWLKLFQNHLQNKQYLINQLKLNLKVYFYLPDKLNTLPTNFLRELAVTKLVDLDKKELIDIITK